jgi:hypothetical protein
VSSSAIASWAKVWLRAAAKIRPGRDQMLWCPPPSTRSTRIDTCCAGLLGRRQPVGSGDRRLESGDEAVAGGGARSVAVGVVADQEPPLFADLDFFDPQVPMLQMFAELEPPLFAPDAAKHWPASPRN